jgi:RNA polymerase sigma-70 factor (ECF subfamily)
MSSRGSGETSDDDLAASAAHGDAAALEALYDRYSAAVMGLSVRILGDSAAAEEIVQETFWRLWRSMTDYRAERGSMQNWLFTIARNLAIDALRRRSTHPQTVQDNADTPLLERLPDPHSDVVEAVWLSFQRDGVRRALAELPEAQRRVIELAYFGGLTRQEIAAATGEPLGTIHTRARLALKKLSETLLELGIES